MARLLLKDICHKITDGSHNPPAGISHSNFLMISSKNIDDDHISLDNPRYLSEIDFKNENRRTNIQPNDVLVTIVGTIGRVAVVEKGMANICLQRSVGVLKPKLNIVNPRFLMYQVQNNRPLLEKEAHGVAQKGIYLKQVEQLPVFIPNIERQQHIVSVIDKLTNLISLRKQQLAKLEELVKARFVEMFGDESNPYNWPYCAVGDVADVCVGVVIKPTQYYTNNGIPAFRSLNIGEMSVKNSDWVYFTQEGHQKNQKSIVRENDVLVVRSGSPGTACVAAKEYAGHNAVDIIIAHPDSSKVNSYFLAMFTNMPHGMIQIRGKIGGAAQQHFNVSGYKSMKLFLPSLCSQNEFALFIEQVDEFRLTIQKSLDKMEVLKKALMQKYFGG